MTSWLPANCAFTANNREFDFDPASLWLLVPRPPEGLGILDPGILDAIGEGALLTRVVVDMYIGGNIVGAGFSLGGSMAERVFPRLRLELDVLAANIECLSFGPETTIPTSFILKAPESVPRPAPFERLGALETSNAILRRLGAVMLLDEVCLVCEPEVNISFC